MVIMVFMQESDRFLRRRFYYFKFGLQRLDLLNFMFYFFAIAGSITSSFSFLVSRLTEIVCSATSPLHLFTLE